MNTHRVLMCLLGAVGVGMLPVAAIAQSFPTKPIRMIVPYNPGGGTDATARIVQKAIEDAKLLARPIAVVNVGGAGGSIGARQAKDAAPDGYTILLHQSALLIQESNGMSDFGSRNFEPIISINRQCMTVGVRDDSPWKTYKDLVDAAKAKPRTIVWGGNIGSANHMSIAVMEKATPGSEFKKVQVGGAAEAYAALKGQIANVGNFGIGEILSFQGGGVHALALLAEERDPAIPNVPTAKELGYDAVFCNEHNLYAPKGTPADRIAVLADAFEKALSTPAVKKAYAETLGASIRIMRGKALVDYLGGELERLRPMAQSMVTK
jgi:tripartite-type tricarboxylate transporter receptor subunit TctC